MKGNIRSGSRNEGQDGRGPPHQAFLSKVKTNLLIMRSFVDYANR